MGWICTISKKCLSYNIFYLEFRMNNNDVNKPYTQSKSGLWCDSCTKACDNVTSHMCGKWTWYCFVVTMYFYFSHVISMVLCHIWLILRDRPGTWIFIITTSGVRYMYLCCGHNMSPDVISVFFSGPSWSMTPILLLRIAPTVPVLRGMGDVALFHNSHLNTFNQTESSIFRFVSLEHTTVLHNFYLFFIVQRKH